MKLFSYSAREQAAIESAGGLFLRHATAPIPVPGSWHTMTMPGELYELDADRLPDVDRQQALLGRSRIAIALTDGTVVAAYREPTEHMDRGKPFTLVSRHSETGQFQHSQLRDHIVRLLKGRKGQAHNRPRRIPPRAQRQAAFRPSPTIQNAYVRWLRALMRQLFAVLREALTPAIAETFRADAIPVRIAHALGDAELRIADVIDEKKIGEQARAVGARVDKLTTGQFKQLLRAQAIPPDTQLQNAFISENIRLIRSLASEQVQRVRDVIEQAAITSEHPNEIAKRLTEQEGIAESRAELIARDQVLKLHGDLVQDRQTALGISQYIWTTSGDERVRPDHDDLDGTVQDWANPPEVDKRTGRHEHPGGDYQCRCTGYPILDELAGLDIDL